MVAAILLDVSGEDFFGVRPFSVVDRPHPVPIGACALGSGGGRGALDSALNGGRIGTPRKALSKARDGRKDHGSPKRGIKHKGTPHIVPPFVWPEAAVC